MVVLYVLIFVILIELLFSSSYHFEKNDENWLNYKNTNIIRGMSVVIVFLHHLSVRLPHHTLFVIIFGNIGFLGVSLFLFCSAYGLMEQYKKNNEYIKKIPSKIIKLYTIYYVWNVISSLLIVIFTNATFHFYSVFIASLYKNNWYVFAILYLYICFYIVHRFNKNKNLNILLFSIFWILIGVALKLGAYWYNTILCFPIGMYVAEYKEKVYSVLNKKYYKFFIFSFLIFLGFVYLNITGYISFVRWLQFIAPIITLIIVNCILLKIQFNSYILNCMNKISYEIYLIHLSIFNLIFTNSNIYSSNTNFLVIVIVLFLSLFLHIFSNKIEKILVYCKKRLKVIS